MTLLRACYFDLVLRAKNSSAKQRKRQRGPDDSSRAIPITHHLQVILVYMWTGVWFVLVYLLSANMQVTEAVGQVWRTSDIYETSAIIAIYTMVFISILALVTLFRDQLMKKKSQL